MASDRSNRILRRAQGHDHAFRSEIKAVPGYVFDVTSADGTLIGTATVLITHDFTDIARIGHIGTEVEPPFRKQGYAARMGRGLLPFLRDHGVRQALLTCDVGHESQAQSYREVGGIDLDVLPPLAPDQRAKARFVVML
jgi:predicted acetyltransferase